MSDVLVYTDGKIRFGFYDNDSDTATGLIDPNIWYHIVCTYNGGAGNASSRLVYINGQSKTLATVGAYASSTLNLAANTDVYLGSQQGNYSFPGSISNFKLWDVALTADEVAAEYALGRTGKSINVTDTAVCLGGTVPRAQLDVRGSARFDGRIFHKGVVCSRYINGGDLYVATNNKIAFDGAVYDPDNLWDTTNRYFIAPVNGVYQISCQLLTDSAGDYDGNHEIYVNGSTNSPRLRGFGVQGGIGNYHRQASSCFILPVSTGDTLEVRSVSGYWWYGSSTYAHSTVSIMLVYAT